MRRNETHVFRLGSWEKDACFIIFWCDVDAPQWGCAKCVQTRNISIIETRVIHFVFFFIYFVKNIIHRGRSLAEDSKLLTLTNKTQWNGKLVISGMKPCKIGDNFFIWWHSSVFVYHEKIVKENHETCTSLSPLLFRKKNMCPFTSQW